MCIDAVVKRRFDGELMMSERVSSLSFSSSSISDVRSSMTASRHQSVGDFVTNNVSDAVTSRRTCSPDDDSLQDVKQASDIEYVYASYLAFLP